MRWDMEDDATINDNGCIRNTKYIKYHTYTQYIHNT